MARRFGRVKTYDEWLRPSIVDNTLDLLRKEPPRHKDEIERVRLCFTTDPFMVGYPEVAKMSIDAIKLINEYNIACVVLTKGVLPTELAKLSEINRYGITLVTLDESFREEMEIGAALLVDRLAALKALSDAGCRTWVSTESYPTSNVCEQELNAISFADQIVFGRAHYDRRTSAYGDLDAFYRGAAEQVRMHCGKKNIVCHIKRGTADPRLLRRLLVAHAASFDVGHWATLADSNPPI